MTATLTDAEAGRLEELAQQASPGPWTADQLLEEEGGEWSVQCEPMMRSYFEPVCYLRRNPKHDAAYLAALDPSTVLRLLSERKALRNALQRSRGCISGLLKRTPVRDVTETLGEIDAALVEVARLHQRNSHLPTCTGEDRAAQRCGCGYWDGMTYRGSEDAGRRATLAEAERLIGERK